METKLQKQRGAHLPTEPLSPPSDLLFHASHHLFPNASSNIFLNSVNLEK